MSALSVKVESGLQNFFFNLRLLPTQIELNRLANKALKDPNFIENYRAEKEAKEQKEEEKKTMRQAEKQAKENNYDNFTKSTKENIIEISGDDKIKRVKIIAKAIETQKLINYAYYYMTDENAAQLKKKNQVERSIINAIADIFDFGTIYESVPAANLKLYDPEYEDDFQENAKYFLSISDIEEMKKDPVWMDKLKKRKEQLAIIRSGNCTEEENQSDSGFWKTDEEGVIHPIFINENGIDLSADGEPAVQGEGISDALFDSLEAAFSPFVGKHRYEKSGDLISLYLIRENNIEERYTIDPGIVMGVGEFYVLANVNFGNGDIDTIFVSTKHDSIIRNIFNIPFYYLNQNEVQEVILDYFRNMELYKYIDMSGTEFLRDLTKDDFQKLGKKLTFIISKVIEQSSYGVPRFRFNYWKSIDDFMLVSDNDVKSSLKETGETSPIICEGLIYQVNGDDVVQTYKTTRIEYHIDKYGEM